MAIRKDIDKGLRWWWNVVSMTSFWQFVHDILLVMMKCHVLHLSMDRRHVQLVGQMATRDWHNKFTMQNFPLPSQNTTKTHLNYWQETQVFVELSLTPVFSCLSLTKYDCCLNIWKICMWQRRDRRSLRARPSLSARKVSKSLGGCGCHLSHIMLQLYRLCQWHHCHVTTRLCQWHHCYN